MVSLPMALGNCSISACPQGLAGLLESPLGQELPHAHSQLLPCGLWVQLTGCASNKSVCSHCCHVPA